MYRIGLNAAVLWGRRREIDCGICWIFKETVAPSSDPRGRFCCGVVKETVASVSGRRCTWVVHFGKIRIGGRVGGHDAGKYCWKRIYSAVLLRWWRDSNVSVYSVLGAVSKIMLKQLRWRSKFVARTEGWLRTHDQILLRDSFPLQLNTCQEKGLGSKIQLGISLKAFVTHNYFQVAGNRQNLNRSS